MQKDNEGVILWAFSLGVTGNRLNPDTLATVAKVRQRLEMYRYTGVLFTGGIFSSDSGQTTPVSELMAAELGKVSIPVMTATKSTITRADVREGIDLLRERGIDLNTVRIEVVSERWHLMGIRLLLRRYLRAPQLHTTPSDFRLDFKRICGRIARLPLYLLDRGGSGRFARWGQKRRGADL